MALSQKLLDAMKEALHRCPLVDQAHFNTFDFTRTGNNLCHPRALGLIAKAAWSLAEIAIVEIDVRLNRGGGIKFQPDLIARDSLGKILLAVDFESPNSSDARVPLKDVVPYLEWVGSVGSDQPPFEYLIITSLPDGPADEWEIRYTSPGHYNEHHQADPIRTNPFRYWYSHYAKKLDPRWRSYPIHFANFDGLELKDVDINRL